MPEFYLWLELVCALSPVSIACLSSLFGRGGTITDEEMDSLPAEILVNVFSYLRPYDRLQVSLVCKRWLKVGDCSKLLRDIFVNTSPNDIVPQELSRRFSSFKYSNALIDKRVIDLSEHLGPRLYYLSFDHCVFNATDFDTHCEADRWSNLKILEISNCDALHLFPSLPQLVELYICNNTTISDRDFHGLRDGMPNLRLFYISCNISFDPRAYRRFYPDEAENDPSPMILSFPAIERFVHERSCSIRSLGFDNTAISAAALDAISLVENLELQKVSLKNCNECSRGLPALFRNQPKLREVDLGGVREITSDVIKSICLLPDIKRISVCRSQFITRFSAERIFQLTGLLAFDLSSCKDITANGFDFAISHLKSFQLESVNLSSCNIKSEAITKLTSACRHLTHLDLSHCDVSDGNVNEVSNTLTRLKYLKLASCRDITDSALTGAGHKNHSLSNIRGLLELHLNECHQITDSGLVNGLMLLELYLLNVTGCHVSDETVSVLTKQNPSLKKILT